MTAQSLRTCTSCRPQQKQSRICHVPCTGVLLPMTLCHVSEGTKSHDISELSKVCLANNARRTPGPKRPKIVMLSKLQYCKQLASSKGEQVHALIILMSTPLGSRVKHELNGTIDFLSFFQGPTSEREPSECIFYEPESECNQWDHLPASTKSACIPGAEPRI